MFNKPEPVFHDVCPMNPGIDVFEQAYAIREEEIH